MRECWYPRARPVALGLEASHEAVPLLKARKAHCWPEPYGIEMKALRLDEHIYNDMLETEERERAALVEAVFRI